MNTKNQLPSELKQLVNKAVAILGDVIKEEAGDKTFKIVDVTRQNMVTYRSASMKDKDQLLNDLYKNLENESAKSKHKIAHSFTLMLELINACEAAYRTFRLRAQERPAPKNKERSNSMIYVLTAHPTEARTPQNIELFSRIQNILVNILEQTAEQDFLESIIKHNLKLLWLLPVTRHEKPEVLDEAKHIFSIIFRKDIFDTLLRADRDLGRIRMRTWVGGDKDGHPGVDEIVMISCLQASRDHFYIIVDNILVKLQKDIRLISDKSLQKDIKQLIVDFKSIKKIQVNDSSKIKSWQSALKDSHEKYNKVIGAYSPRFSKLLAIMTMFPGLVIPIELREDSGLIAEALSSDKDLPIKKMLVELSKISKGKDTRNYAQGFIISMCHSYEDIENAIKLSKLTIGDLSIPIIPLFETNEALDDSSKIVTKLLKNKEYVKSVQKNWHNHLEVMLGYSDSSKGMGVLPSRIAIAKTLRSLDLLISDNGFIPVFFHGSGGSVDRGGGSIKEQTAWWPKSALNIYKATIQGEMVERTFTSSEVVLSGIDKIITNFKEVKSKKGVIKVDKSVDDFANEVAFSYKEKIAQTDFFKMVGAATPYSYLNVLKLGSRPTKRSTSTSTTLDFSSIRAIPWILCWTQTRILFPSWWGVGSAWNNIKNDKKKTNELKKSYTTSSLFSSYIRTLGFTLSKVDLSIFKLYLNKSNLPEDEKLKVFNEFQIEYKQVISFLKFLTGENKLLWNQLWLADSINLRSSMIHPLNVLQIQANKDKDEELIRKTVAGISSGMMTTG